MQKPNRSFSFVSKITFSGFRNYLNLSFDITSKTNLIVGANGIGKTNIIEAISLISSGKGLRSSKMEEMSSLFSSSDNWCLDFLINSRFGDEQIKILYEKPDNLGNVKKVTIVNGNKCKNKDEINSLIGVCWLTPQMDQVFLQGSSVRRRFIDKMISGFYKGHRSALAKYDYLIKERISILKSEVVDPAWISVIERKIAETSIIIAEARKKFCDEINAIIKKLPYSIPKAQIKFDGFVENKFGSVSALQLEGEICEILQQNRAVDAKAERTKAGIHLSDLLVCESEKGLNVKFCSTGEQKSLLLSVFLGEIYTHIKLYNRVPVILLDDIFSHLDKKKREIIFEVIEDLGAQTFITAVDADSLGIKSDEVDKITIINNEIKRLN